MPGVIVDAQQDGFVRTRRRLQPRRHFRHMEGCDARVGDAGYIHDYGSGKVQTFHVSRVVGQVRYNDGTWLHYQASRPTLTLQTCMDWKPTGNRYIVQLT